MVGNARRYEPPVRAGWKADDAYHRRNLRALQEFLQSPFVNAANIQDASITSAKISDLSADKITAGTLTSAVLVTGIIRAPSDTGYRVELGDASWPLRYWDGSTTKFALDDSGNLTLVGQIEDENGLPIIRSTGLSRCKVRNGGGDTLSTATETTLTIATEDSDTDSYWNGSNSYVIVPFTGQYMVLWQVSFAADNNGRRYMQIQTADAPYSSWSSVTGASFASCQPIATDRSTLQVADVFDLNAQAAIRVRAFQNSGGNLNAQHRLAVVFLGPS